VGQNYKNDPSKKMPNPKGNLYSDFLVQNNLLYLSHGRFISIVDINLPMT
jgi:hypothetical protein